MDDDTFASVMTGVTLGALCLKSEMTLQAEAALASIEVKP